MFRLWQAGGRGRAQRIANKGLVPQAGFGTAITGLSNQDMEDIRKITEIGHGGRRKGRHLARQRLVDGDPASELAIEPILEWAKEAKAMHRRDDGACTRAELALYWQGACKRNTKKWCNARGPADVTRLSLHRLGWSWPKPWVLANEQGLEFDMTAASLPLLRWQLRETGRRRLEQQVAKAMQQRGWQETGEALSGAIPRRVMAESKHGPCSKGIARSIALGTW